MQCTVDSVQQSHAPNLPHKQCLCSRQWQEAGQANNWRTCDICLDDYTLEGEHMPRCLPCQHVLCTTCVNKRCKQGEVRCPVCRESFAPAKRFAPNGDLTVPANGFPSALWVLQNVEATCSSKGAVLIHPAITLQPPAGSQAHPANISSFCNKGCCSSGMVHDVRLAVE